MSADKKKVKVDIAGKEYTIIGERSAVHIELVAETINEQLKKIEESSNHLTKEERSILVAINAISDQMDSHEKMLEMKNKGKKKTD